MKRFPALTVVVLALLLLSGPVVAAPAAGQAGAGQDQGRGLGQRRLQLELAWTAYGILEMDKKPALRITPAQAAKLLGILEDVQKRMADDTRRPQNGGAQNSGQQGGAGAWQNMSAADRERLRKQLEARQAELQGALDQIDKILSAKQVEFLDNLDFDESQYTIRRPQGLGGSGGGQGSFNPQQVAEFRKQAEAVRARLEKIFTQTVDYLRTRSKAKK